MQACGTCTARPDDAGATFSALQSPPHPTPHPPAPGTQVEQTAFFVRLPACQPIHALPRFPSGRYAMTEGGQSHADPQPVVPHARPYPSSSLRNVGGSGLGTNCAFPTKGYIGERAEDPKPLTDRWPCPAVNGGARVVCACIRKRAPRQGQESRRWTSGCGMQMPHAPVRGRRSRAADREATTHGRSQACRPRDGGRRPLTCKTPGRTPPNTTPRGKHPRQPSRWSLVPAGLEPGTVPDNPDQQ